MNISAKQVSSLEKIRSKEDIKNEVNEVQLFLGEHYSYQIVLETDICTVAEISVESKLSNCINVYSVENSIMDFPCYSECDR